MSQRSEAWRAWRVRVLRAWGRHCAGWSLRRIADATAHVRPDVHGDGPITPARAQQLVAQGGRMVRVSLERLQKQARDRADVSAQG